MLLASSHDVFVVVVACAMMSSVMTHDVCIYIYAYYIAGITSVSTPT